MLGTENNVSLYDTLLDLSDEFDAAGKGEIFRLLLERRSAIPLFLPHANGSNLMLFKNITSSLSNTTTISLGADKTLGRVAVISRRNANESQSPELLKNLFHIESLHRQDFFENYITRQPITAEIGVGCVKIDEQVQYFLVLHVVGDFQPLWPFVQHFSDHLLIEDSVDVDSNYRSALLSDSPSLELDPIPSVSLWRQTCGRMNVVKRDDRRFCIDGPFGDKVSGELQKNILSAFSATGPAKANSKNPSRLSLCEMRRFLPDEMLETVDGYTTTWDVDSVVRGSNASLAEIRAHQLVLQKNYRQQAKHEELKWFYRLDDVRQGEQNVEISKLVEKRKKEAKNGRGNPLLVLLQNITSTDDPCARVLAVRQLEMTIALQSEQELGAQRERMNFLYKRYAELSTQLTAGNNNPELVDCKGELQNARIKYNESVLSIEHLWRELSHLYTAAPAQFRHLPKLAARHLVDGFSVELLDGDSNMVNLQWIQQVLTELGQLIDKSKQRIFVLSIMGVQSSGKSTLLNTMFGIQMKTSVGQCTRGVNMQLLKVEGRQEYDYVLVLDTEGTRAPEYHGLEGSEKRDNQMATLSILLADATIIVNPGENDAAIKEILPIVLMAYQVSNSLLYFIANRYRNLIISQGSKLAEDNGGRLSTMMFFVYNRIDTTQKEKLSTIIQTLAASLNDAFDAVLNLDGNVNTSQQRSTAAAHLNSESPLRNFRIDSSNSSESDVRILGNVKEKFTPPGDVPDPVYGKALAEFREHIHERVTGVRGGSGWKSRSLNQFSNYLADVWQCIGTANFTLHFKSLVERTNFDQLEAEYKKCEQQLAGTYQMRFSEEQKSMITKKGETGNVNIDDIVRSMHNGVVVEEQKLDEQVTGIVSRKGREKWRLKYEEMWKEYKVNQASHWKRLLSSSFNTMFNYDSQVEKMKKDMRQRIRKLFSSPTLETGEWNQKKKEEEFNKMYDQILEEAKMKFPPIDVGGRIKKIYQESPLIKSRKFELTNDAVEKECIFIIQHQFKEALDGETSAGQCSENFLKTLFNNIIRRPYRGLLEYRKCEPTEYQRAIFAFVKNCLVGKICFDDSIADDVIQNTEIILKKPASKKLQNKDYQKAHIYARNLITTLLTVLQKDWERENSVYVKLEQESNRAAMRQYFMVASQGVERTKLFICLLKTTLEDNLTEAFEQEMVHCTTNRIRNEKWLHNGKFMQNHLDLYLIDLLENDKVNDVLDLLRYPKKLYTKVLQQLVATKIPAVESEYNKFVNCLKTQIHSSISQSISVKSGRAVFLITALRSACVNVLLSQFLGQKLLIECGDEYADCDKEDADAFEKSCTESLIGALDAFELDIDSTEFAKSLTLKVIDFMKTQNDPAALPRCDVHCPWCKSLCMEVANHNTKLKLHDTIHQPTGLAGVRDRTTKILRHKACSQYDDNEELYKNDEKLGKFADYETIFPGWLKPKWAENWPLREYILANYNEDIAKLYGVLPSSEIPTEYKRDLDCIRDNIQSQLQNLNNEE